VQTRFPTTFLILARAAFGEDVSALPDAAAAALAADAPVGPEGLDHFVYLGRGWTYGLAQEAALKIREAAQAWSESYPLLDYRHGPLAVAHPGSLVWFIGARDDDLVRQFGARRVGHAGDDDLRDAFGDSRQRFGDLRRRARAGDRDDRVVRAPRPRLGGVGGIRLAKPRRLAQRLAVDVARSRGLDPDQPRHLTRSIVLS
jgi:hypothetical protein